MCEDTVAKKVMMPMRMYDDDQNHYHGRLGTRLKRHNSMMDRCQIRRSLDTINHL